MLSIPRRLASTPSFVRAFTARAKYPRPRPGTSERPPLKHRDALLTSPNATVTKLEDENVVFVHRPPPSVAAPESTTAFPSSPLLQSKPSASAASSSSPSSTTRLPPLVKAEKPKPELKELSEEDVEKMRELRLSNPEKYSANVLAKMFGCTRFFVTQRVHLRTSQRNALLKKQETEHEKNRSRWSERHQLVKAVRVKRRELW